jgi:Family of unknown function (DUF5681)
MTEKPPSETPSNTGRFRKGRSGNPGGRPRAASAARGSVFDVVLEKTLTVPHDGGTREVTIEEALQQRTYHDALAGKRMAIKEVVKWIKEREVSRAEHAPKPRKEVTLRPAPDPDNADAALVLLGIAAPDQDCAWFSGRALLLEPWAVQAAFRRRRGGRRLTDGEREEIERSTRDPDSLRWPRGTDR